MCVAVGLMFTACKNTESRSSSCILIDIEEWVTKNVSDKMTFNDIAEVVNVIPVDNDIVIESVVVIGETGEYLLIKENKPYNDQLYLMDKNNGKIFAEVGRRGNGPGEYNMIMGVAVDEENIYVYDINKKCQIVYSLDGKYKETIDRGLGGFNVLKDGNYVAGPNPFFRNGEVFSVYDREFNKIRESEINIEIPEGAMRLDVFTKYNDECYYLGNDTTYRVTTESDDPFLVVNLGKYKRPLKNAATRDGNDESAHKYINKGGDIMSSKYLFFTYMYDELSYSEVWDMEAEKPVFRTHFTYELGEDGMPKNIKGIGVPVKIGDEEVEVWPSYISGDDIYCVSFGYGDAMKLFPDMKEDDNPVILHLRLK